MLLVERGEVDRNHLDAVVLKELLENLVHDMGLRFRR